jgi:hypothetical protein
MVSVVLPRFENTPLPDHAVVTSSEPSARAAMAP